MQEKYCIGYTSHTEKAYMYLYAQRATLEAEDRWHRPIGGDGINPGTDQYQ
jgi:hypothetical protein